MIKKSNTRIIITMSKAQAEWLKKNSKKLNMSVSKFIKWLMDKNIGRLASELPKEDLEHLIKICKFKWINLTDEEIEESYYRRTSR